MRTFLAILLAVLGIGAAVLTLIGFGTMTLFWMVAHYIVAAALIWAAVVMYRSRVLDGDNATDYTNNPSNYTYTR